jgi:Tyrosyl-DNA phosphodiesterase
MDGNINCMHSKLMLLAHKTHLRVVIPSANLTAYDWGETGCLENVRSHTNNGVFKCS